MVQINAYSLLTIVTKSPILDVSGQLDLLLYTLYKLYRKVYGNLLSLWSSINKKANTSQSLSLI